MQLADALGIKRGDILSFVGAGGKTSALFRLAKELMARGWTVITTTTTKMAVEERLMAPGILKIDRINELAEALSEARHVFVFDHIDTEKGKVIGIAPERVSDLAAAADVVLIEADGARRLPLKGPYPHEPVIPAATTLAVPVAGLDAISAPLDGDHVYGAENITRQLGVDEPSPVVTAELIGAVLGHNQLGGKDVPSGARIVGLLNKAESCASEEARRAAHEALTNPNIDRVLIGAVQQDDPIQYVEQRIGAVVLAAGLSRRMGEPKVLLPWGKGSTIIREIVRTVSDLPLAEVVVVTGRWDNPIRDQLKGLPVKVTHNPQYAEGEMISSVKAGLEGLESPVGAALVVLGDQPNLHPDIVTRLLDAYGRTLAPIVAPVYQGQRGHPVLFDQLLWREILALPAGAAPRDILRAHQDEILRVEVKTDSILQDIDTPEDYQRERPD